MCARSTSRWSCSSPTTWSAPSVGRCPRPCSWTRTIEEAPGRDPGSSLHEHGRGHRPTDGADQVVGVVERGTLEARLQQGLDRLSPDFRLAVVLCDLQGLTYEEITEATGWPIGTVRSRIHRARRSLREHLAATSSEAEDAISRRPRAGWEPDRGEVLPQRAPGAVDARPD